MKFALLKKYTRETLFDLFGSTAFEARALNEVAYIATHLLRYPDELWQDAGVRARLAMRAPKSPILLDLVSLLQSVNSLGPRERLRLGWWMRGAPEIIVELHLVGDLILRLHKRGVVDAIGLCSGHVKHCARWKGLFNSLLILSVLEPARIPERRLKRITFLRAGRVRRLARTMVCFQAKTDSEVRSAFVSLAREMKSLQIEEHYTLVSDLWWILYEKNKAWVGPFLDAALEAGDCRNCEMLILLVADDQSPQNIRRLQMLRDLGTPEVTSVCNKVLASLGA
jgi:hypothetical protein